ncbi:hypothetical protein [Priestia aryabhattai]|uniref:hypothetical protein n=1 Tax=Priestia aryabhattai TaxID=412384 RepID=UPI0015F48475|nr:hypothetical protein [Priestia aryabhattai]
MKVWELKELLNNYDDNQEVTVNVGEDVSENEIPTRYVLTSYVNDKPVVSIKSYKKEEHIPEKKTEERDYLITGEMVTVMYPYDANWWKTEGFVTCFEGDDMYLIEDIKGNKLSVHIQYVKF